MRCARLGVFGAALLTLATVDACSAIQRSDEHAGRAGRTTVTKRTHFDGGRLAPQSSGSTRDRCNYTGGGSGPRVPGHGRRLQARAMLSGVPTRCRCTTDPTKHKANRTGSDVRPSINSRTAKHPLAAERRTRVFDAVRHLAPHRRELVSRVFGINRAAQSVRSVAEAWGAPKSRVDRMLVRALADLRLMLVERGR